MPESDILIQPNLIQSTHTQTAHTQTALSQSVYVTAAARLHMGFFDLNGSLGRRFGGIGLGLDAPVTEIIVRKNAKHEALPADFELKDERANKILQHFIQAYHLQDSLSVCCLQLIPAHAGLGSGTQMALAIGSAINQLCGLNISVQQLAHEAQRGSRSGIGVGTFMQGGVIIDGGRGLLTEVPPIIASAEFPQAWRVLLIFDNAEIGTHGEQETTAFGTLPEASLASAEKLSHRVLMQALPALAEQDLTSFGAAIRELQAYTGDYFAPVQGGRYASKDVAQVLNYLDLQGVACFGQSSWGPTGFAILASQASADLMLEQLKAAFSHCPNLSFKSCRGLNRGAHHTMSYSTL